MNSITNFDNEEALMAKTRSKIINFLFYQQ